MIDVYFIANCELATFQTLDAILYQFKDLPKLLWLVFLVMVRHVVCPLLHLRCAQPAPALVAGAAGAAPAQVAPEVSLA